MADVGGGPNALIKKRIEAQIAKFEAQKVNQELEIMETEETVNRLRANIEATEKEIQKQKDSLVALERAAPISDGEVNNG